MKGESYEMSVQEVLEFRELAAYLGLDGYLTRVLERELFKLPEDRRRDFLECLKKRSCGITKLLGIEEVDRTLTWVFNRRDLLINQKRKSKERSLRNGN